MRPTHGIAGNFWTASRTSDFSARRLYIVGGILEQCLKVSKKTGKNTHSKKLLFSPRSGGFLGLFFCFFRYFLNFGQILECLGKIT